MKKTNKRIRLVQDNIGGVGTSILLHENEEGKMHVSEKDFNRAVKRMGCSRYDVRLESGVEKMLGVNQIPVKREEPFVLTTVATIGTTFFYHN